VLPIQPKQNSELAKQHGVIWSKRQYLPRHAIALRSQQCRLWLVIFCLWIAVGLPNCQYLSAIPIQPLEPRLTAQELAVIVNQADPISVEIGQYYQQQRQIPPQNVITVEFTPGQSVLSPEAFQDIYDRVTAATPAHIQAYALTWAAPYRVGCMSITMAFAAGYDKRFCATGCQPTPINPYFNSDSVTPFDDFGLRPTMAIAATTLEQAKQLIDRGIASDYSYPMGTAYLMDTSDRNRNVRAFLFPTIISQLGSDFDVKIIKADALEYQFDVMFYFTGLSQVKQIETNLYLPGAIADHLTSFGGALTDTPQMSSLRWLEAGATGSYGTVVEPCNFPQKFPHPGVVMARYLQGDTLLEAYWKSLVWLGQGIFIGEPLARPFGVL